MRVVVIGSGNTATVLSRRIRGAGHPIIQVFSRNIDNARQLADITDASYTDRRDSIITNADLYIIAVSDSILPETADWLKLGNRLVVHTAGSVTMEVLKTVSTNYGILYPLQSLRKEMQLIPDIPFLIDANTADNLDTLRSFAETLSDHVQVADDAARTKLHVAAVIANNFTNHLFTLTEDFCKKENADFKMLMPLIIEVANRLERYPPSQLQTGPAIRNDQDTIRKHQEIISAHPRLRAIYDLFTKSIIDYYKH